MFLMSTEPSMELDNQFSRDISNMFPDSIVPKDTENPIGNESKNSHGAFRIVHIPFKDQQSTNLDNLLRIESSILSWKCINNQQHIILVSYLFFRQLKSIMIIILYRVLKKILF